MSLHLFFYNIIDCNWARQKNMKNILQRDIQKRDNKIQLKHISHYFLKQSSEKRQEGVDTGGKIE